MQTNTLRMLPDSFKFSTAPAVTQMFFADNENRVWRVSISTAFKLKPKVAIMEVTEAVPENWQELSADDIQLAVAFHFLDELSAMTSEKVTDGAR